MWLPLRLLESIAYVEVAKNGIAGNVGSVILEDLSIDLLLLRGHESQTDLHLSHGVAGSLLTPDLEVELRIRREDPASMEKLGDLRSKLFGDTADFAAGAGVDSSEFQLTIGIRAWF